MKICNKSQPGGSQNHKKASNRRALAVRHLSRNRRNKRLAPQQKPSKLATNRMQVAQKRGGNKARLDEALLEGVFHGEGAGVPARRGRRDFSGTEPSRRRSGARRSGRNIQRSTFPRRADAMKTLIYRPVAMTPLQSRTFAGLDMHFQGSQRQAPREAVCPRARRHCRHCLSWQES